MNASPTLILAIENSNPSSGIGDDVPGVAFGRASPDSRSVEVLGIEPLRPQGPNDDDLMAAIERLARRLGVVPPQIGGVAVSIGPGGYTAMRIAIATAKMIAEVTGARTVAVPTAEVAARSATKGAGDFAVALASKRETAFVTVFGPDRRAKAPGSVMTAADLDGLIQEGTRIGRFICDRFIPDNFRRILDGEGVAIETLRLNPRACLDASLSIAPVNPLALAPLYAREPEAVTIWRTKKS